MTKYCSKCGKENDDNSKFCGSCGEKLSGLHTINKIDKDNTQNDIDNKDDKNKQIILIGAVVVLVIAIAIVGAFTFMPFNDNNNNDNNFSNNVDTNLDNNNVDTASVTSSSIPLSEVYGLAETYVNIIGVDDPYFSSIYYKDVTFTRDQCLYIFAKAIDMKNQGTDGTINFKSFGSPDNPSSESSNVYVTKSEYVDMAQRTIVWMEKNGRSPNHIGIYADGDGDIGYYWLVKYFARIILESENSSLPQSYPM